MSGMKLIKYFLLLTLMSGSAMAAYVKTSPSASVVIGCEFPSRGTYHPDGPPPVVWPWGQEVRFPWKQISGVWTAGRNDSAQYYIFKTLGTSKSGRELDITLYDPLACATVASGKGFENATTHVVTAFLTSAYGSYEMSVHAFDPQSVPQTCERTSVQDGSVLMVLSIYGDEPDDTTNFQLRQIDTAAQALCK